MSYIKSSVKFSYVIKPVKRNSKLDFGTIPILVYASS